MKYKITLEDRVWQGFVFSAKEVPSTLSEWFRFWRFFNVTKYATLSEHHGFYIQKVNTSEVWLVQESADGTICYVDSRQKDFTPAPKIIQDLYNATLKQIEKDFKEK